MTTSSEIPAGAARRRRRREFGTAGRRRRPAGEPPPLPHHLGRSGRFWIAMAAYFALTIVGVLLFNPLEHFVDEVDSRILTVFTSLRTTAVDHIAMVVNVLASRWTIRILRWSTILALIVFRRWRHLLVYVGALIVLELVTLQMSLFLARPRPFGVTVLGPWLGFSTPSRPLASVAISLLGVLYTLVPHGRIRDAGKWAAGVVLGVLIVARLILAIEEPSAAVFGAILGVAIGLSAFRLFLANDVFPVTYRRGKSAHLDVTGARGEAIVRAVADQLGEKVVDIKPIGLEGSGGSTPLRLTVERDGDHHYVFAKLYAMSHVRADRWYKLGRQILYGALEDETPFGTVRRFVEYEDYALRYLYDQGFPSPEPYGIVEITPEREYMILMDFFEGAVEISEADVGPKVIDEGLQLIRRMWDVGVAHRDVKPANLMVQDGTTLRLIDVFFMQVRPSPWRQAVDLANMMLVLALRSDANTVYGHALQYFTPDEIAEAFAATRGVASPTQLRSMLKDDERDLIAEFRALAPHRDPVRIQRWSLRRVALTVWVAIVAFIAISLITSNWAVFA
jgi:tRNA A-37 threonylcarbamoyl transferase component Bud32